MVVWAWFGLNGLGVLQDKGVHPGAVCLAGWEGLVWDFVWVIAGFSGFACRQLTCLLLPVRCSRVSGVCLSCVWRDLALGTMPESPFCGRHPRKSNKYTPH